MSFILLLLCVFIVETIATNQCFLDGKELEFDENGFVTISLKCEETIKSVEISPALPEGLYVKENREIVGIVNHSLPTTEYEVKINNRDIFHFNLTILSHIRELADEIPSCNSGEEVLSIYVQIVDIGNSITVSLYDQNDIVNSWDSFNAFSSFVDHICLSTGEYRMDIQSNSKCGPTITLKNSGKYVYKQHKVEDLVGIIIYESFNFAHSHSDKPILNYPDLPNVIQAYEYVDYSLDIINGASSLIFDGLPSTINANKETGRISGYFESGYYSFSVIGINDFGESDKLMKAIHVISCSYPSIPLVIEIECGDDGENVIVYLQSLSRGYFYYGGLENNQNYTRSYCLNRYDLLYLTVSSLNGQKWLNSKVRVIFNGFENEYVFEGNRMPINLAPDTISSDSEWSYYDGKIESNDWNNKFRMNDPLWKISKTSELPNKNDNYRYYRTIFYYDGSQYSYINIECNYEEKIKIYINSNEIFKSEEYNGNRTIVIKMGLDILQFGMNYIGIEIETKEVNNSRKYPFSFELNCYAGNGCEKMNVYDDSMKCNVYSYDRDGKERRLELNHEDGGKYLIDGDTTTKLSVPVNTSDRLIAIEVFFKDNYFINFNKYKITTTDIDFESKNPKKWEIRGIMSNSILNTSDFTYLIDSVEDGDLPSSSQTAKEFKVNNSNFRVNNGIEMLIYNKSDDSVDGLEMSEIEFYNCKPKLCEEKDDFRYFGYAGNIIELPCISNSSIYKKKATCEENGEWSIDECEIMNLDFSYNNESNEMIFFNYLEQSYSPTISDENITFDSFKCNCILPSDINFNSSDGSISGKSNESGMVFCSIEGIYEDNYHSIGLNISIDGVVYDNLSYLFHVNKKKSIFPTLYGKYKDEYRFTIDEELPSGLYLNSTSGEIYGKATNISENRNYTITVRCDVVNIQMLISISIEVREESNNEEFYSLITSNDEIIEINQSYIIDMNEWNIPKSLLFKKLITIGNNTIRMIHYKKENENNELTLFDSFENKSIIHLHLIIESRDGIIMNPSIKTTSDGIIRRMINSYLYDVELKLNCEIVMIENENKRFGLLSNSMENMIMIHVGISFEKSISINSLEYRSEFGLISGIIKNDEVKELSGIFIKGNEYKFESSNNESEYLVTEGLLFGLCENLIISYSFVDLNSYNIKGLRGMMNSLTIGYSTESSSYMRFYRCFTIIRNEVNIDVKELSIFSHYLSIVDVNEIIDECFSEMRISEISGINEIYGFGGVNEKKKEKVNISISNSYINYEISKEIDNEKMSLYLIGKYVKSECSLSNIYISLNIENGLKISCKFYDIKENENNQIETNVVITKPREIELMNKNVNILNKEELNMNELIYKYLNGFYISEESKPKSKLYYSIMPRYDGNEIIDEYKILENVDISFDEINNPYYKRNESSIWYRNDNPYSFIYSMKSYYSIFIIPKESESIRINISSKSECIEFNPKSIELINPIEMIRDENNNRIMMNVSKCVNESYSRHEIEMKELDNNISKSISLEIINMEMKPEYESDLSESIDYDNEFSIYFKLPYPSKVELISVIDIDKEEENKELIMNLNENEEIYDLNRYLYKMKMISGNVSIPTKVEFVLKVIFDNNGYKRNEYNYTLKTTIKPKFAEYFKYGDNNNILIRDEEFIIKAEYEGYGGVFSIMNESLKNELESAGILFNSSDGSFYGKTNQTFEDVEIEVKMKNERYENISKLRIEVIYPPPNRLKYEDKYELMVGEEFEIIPLEWDDKVEAKFSYESLIKLEDYNISLNNETGRISGIPSIELKENEIKVILGNRAGNISFEFIITIIYPPPNRLKYEEKYELVIGEEFEIIPLEYDDKVEAKFSYESLIELEDYNISLNNENGIMSGNPSKVLKENEIKVILGNRAGNISFVMKLSIIFEPTTEIENNEEETTTSELSSTTSSSTLETTPEISITNNEEETKSDEETSTVQSTATTPELPTTTPIQSTTVDPSLHTIECKYQTKKVYIKKEGKDIIPTKNTESNIKYSSNNCKIDENSGNITINTNEMTDNYVKCEIICKKEGYLDGTGYFQYKVSDYSPTVDKLLSKFPYIIYPDEIFDISLILSYPLIPESDLPDGLEKEILTIEMSLNNIKNDEYKLMNDIPFIDTNTTEFNYENINITTDKREEGRISFLFKTTNPSNNNNKINYISEDIRIRGKQSISDGDGNNDNDNDIKICRKVDRDGMGLCCNENERDYVNGLMCKNLTVIIPFSAEVDEVIVEKYDDILYGITFNNTNHVWKVEIEDENKTSIVIRINLERMNNLKLDNSFRYFEDYEYAKSMMSLLECSEEEEVEEKIKVLPSSVKEVLVGSVKENLISSIVKIVEVIENNGNSIDLTKGIEYDYDYISPTKPTETKDESWIEDNWWIVLLICIGVVLVLVIIVSISISKSSRKSIKEKEIKKSEKILENIIPIEKIKEENEITDDEIYKPFSYEIIMEGYLLKEGHDRVLDKWQRRYFVLYYDPCSLRIYESMIPSYYGKVYVEEKQNIPLECYSGIEYVEGRNEFTLILKVRDSNLKTFEVGDKERKIHLKVEGENGNEIAKKWVECFRDIKNQKPKVNESCVMPIIIDENKGKIGLKTNKCCEKENEERINRIIERKNINQK